MSDWREEEPGIWTLSTHDKIWIEAVRCIETRRGVEETYDGWQVRMEGKPMAAYRRLQDAKRAASWWARWLPSAPEAAGDSAE